jgi:membrane-bound ClpP family serine protease
MLIGLALLLSELFFFHTAGILGIVGAILFIGGLFLVMLPGVDSIAFEFDTQTFNAAGEEFLKRLGWLSATFIAATIIMLLLARYISPSFRGLNRLVLSGHEQEASEGYIAGENPALLPQPGTKGIVMATLRPSGKVIIDGKIYEAITAGSFIAKDQKIKVEKVEGSIIIVNIDEEEFQ